MRTSDAKRLHNEDEVIDKETGESIRVLSVKTVPKVTAYGATGVWVVIEGVGEKQGYGEWTANQVK